MNRVDWIHIWTMWLVTIKILGYVTFSWYWCFVPVGIVLTLAILSKLFLKLIEIGQKAAQDKIAKE